MPRQFLECSLVPFAIPSLQWFYGWGHIPFGPSNCNCCTARRASLVSASVQHVPPASRWHLADLLRGNCCRKRLVQTDVCKVLYYVDDSVMFNLWYYSGDPWRSVEYIIMIYYVDYEQSSELGIDDHSLSCSCFFGAPTTQMGKLKELLFAHTRPCDWRQRVWRRESRRVTEWVYCMGWPGAKCKTQESIWQCVKTNSTPGEHQNSW